MSRVIIKQYRTSLRRITAVSSVDTLCNRTITSVILLLQQSYKQESNTELLTFPTQYAQILCLVLLL